MKTCYDAYGFINVCGFNNDIHYFSCTETDSVHNYSSITNHYYNLTITGH